MDNGSTNRFELHLFLHQVGDPHAQLAEIKDLLHTIINQQEKLLMTEQEALAAIKKVDDLTTAQGVALQAEGDLLQKISDEVDKLIAGGQIPAAVAARLQVLSDGVQAVSNTIDKQAEVSKAILAKGSVALPAVPPVTPITI